MAAASSKKPPAAPHFFARPADFRKWLAKHAATATELLVGYYKVGSGKPSITWPESVDEALCFGWIDGVRRRVDDQAYTVRFTPRKPTSIWSAVNIRRVEALTAEQRMQPGGLRAFELRRENRSGIYAYEQRPESLGDIFEPVMRKNKAAWQYFSAQPPSYRRAAIWFVISAKQESTRMRRLAQLIDVSAAGQWLPQHSRT